MKLTDRIECIETLNQLLRDLGWEKSSILNEYYLPTDDEECPALIIQFKKNGRAYMHTLLHPRERYEIIDLQNLITLPMMLQYNHTKRIVLNQLSNILQ